MHALQASFSTVGGANLSSMLVFCHYNVLLCVCSGSYTICQWPPYGCETEGALLAVPLL